MQFKERLQDYTQLEFYQFLQRIWTQAPGEDHDRLIEHFDRVVGHPAGADLLFYPPLTRMSDVLSEADVAMQAIMSWYASQRQKPFKPHSNPQAAPAVSKGYVERELEKARSAGQELEQCYQAAQASSVVFEQCLAEAESYKVLSESKEQADQAVQKLERMDVLRTAWVSTLIAHQRSGSHFDMFLTHARQRRASPKDQAAHQALLDALGDNARRYLEQREAFVQQEKKLHDRAEAIFERLQQDVVRASALAGTGPLKELVCLSGQLAGVDTHPKLIAQEASKFQEDARYWRGLGKAIRSAVTALTWEVAESGRVLQASVMSLGDYKPGCGEPLAVSVPLRDLMPCEGRDWQYLALAQGEVDLAHRLRFEQRPFQHGKLWHGLREIKEQRNVCVVRTGGIGPGAAVKIRAAAWDANAQGWRVQSADRRVQSVLWHSPPAWAAQLSIAPEHSRGGVYAAHGVPDVMPTDPALLIDDCVVVFPPHSGIEPVYLAFKSPSEYPGVVSGQGVAVTGRWLLDDARSYAVAGPIAARLRGQVFERFSHLQAALWKTVTEVPELYGAFDAEDQALLAQGLAPLQPGRIRFDFLRNPLDGGELYDLDNLRITCIR